MKKFLLLLVCFISIGIASNAEAFPNEPNGFRDLYWGESLQEVKNSGYDVQYLQYYPEENAVIYYCFLNNPYVSNQKCELVMLYFWNNKLYSISLSFGTPYKYDASIQKMANSLMAMWGFDFQTMNDGWCWLGTTTRASLISDNTGGSFCIILTSENLSEQAAKDAASKGW